MFCLMHSFRHVFAIYTLGEGTGFAGFKKKRTTKSGIQRYEPMNENVGPLLFYGYT